MNRLVSIAVMVAMLAVNPAAWADSWRGQGNPGHGAGQWHGQGGQGYGNGQWHGSGQWHGGNWHGNNNWHGGYYKPYPGYGYRPYYAHGYYPYRPYYYYPYYRPVGYPYPYYGGYYGGGYYPYYQHHNNNNHSDWPAYLAGGLIVGALAMNAYNKSQQPNYSYAQSAPAAHVGSVQGRHLLRDLSGKCYERQTDANGNEMRTELPPSECNW